MAKDAVTEYKILKTMRLPDAGGKEASFSLLEVSPMTGRTHQIRVHMAHIRFPLLGDPVYGGRFQMPANCNEQLEKELRSFKRQALHAEKLGLQHPVTNEYMEWIQPLPEDMVRLLDALASNEPTEL